MCQYNMNVYEFVIYSVAGFLHMYVYIFKEKHTKAKCNLFREQTSKITKNLKIKRKNLSVFYNIKHF